MLLNFHLKSLLTPSVAISDFHKLNMAKYDTIIGTEDTPHPSALPMLTVKFRSSTSRPMAATSVQTRTEEVLEVFYVNEICTVMIDQITRS